MKKLLLLFSLFSSVLGAQEKNFSDLFIPARESCYEKDQRLPQLISSSSREENRQNLDSLLNYWQKDCGNTELQIRTKILHELSLGKSLDSTASLSEFYSLYITNLPYYNANSTLRKYLNYTAAWAEEILSSKEWAARESLCLKILSCSRFQKANNLIYRSKTLKLKEGRETEKSLTEQSTSLSDFYIYIAYANTIYTQALAENIGTSHGFAISAGGIYRKHNYGVDFILSFPVSSDSLRIDLENVIQKSEINSNLYFGGYYGYEFLKAARTSLAFRTTLGYTILATDLNTYDAETDTESPFGLESLSLGLGLEWKVRIYGTRQIGIRSSYNYCNFSRNNELRSNLSGSIIQTALFFQF
tara:strand:- start:25086 stop:26162 length:1077 start_codon:yes stop_codon:yes gene_type:complete